VGIFTPLPPPEYQSGSGMLIGLKKTANIA